MRCPNCTNEDTKVHGQPPGGRGERHPQAPPVRKVRIRFSTYEEMEILDLTVVKKDGSKQLFSREKLERGLRRAFEKRPHTDETFRKLISLIEQDIQKKAKDGAITSLDIGEIVMKKIKRIDKIAYIRSHPFIASSRMFRSSRRNLVN